MANIFNADDGAISGSAGIKLSSDTSGVLNIQTNGTTAISISSSQVVSFPSTTSIGTLYFAAGTAAAPSISVTGDTNTGIYFPGADQVAITTAGAQRFYVGATGDVGIGTGSPGKKLQLDGGNAYTAALRFSYGAGASTYYADWGYKSNGNKVYLTITDGGSAVDVLTANYDGNVGIGTTSPGALLHVYTGAQESVRFARNSTASSAYVTFYANNSSSAQVQYAGILGDVASSTAGSHGGNLLFYTTGSGTSAERARITSGGDLLVGTTSGAGKIQVESTGVQAILRNTSASGYTSLRLYNDQNSSVRALEIDYFGSSASGGERAEVFATGAYHLAFGTNNTERARITSGGNLLIGGTADHGRLTVQNVTTGVCLALATPSAVRQIFWIPDGYYGYQCVQTIYADGGKAFIFANAAGTEVGTIVVNNASTAYNTTSDYRLKDEQKPLTGSGAFIDAIKPKEWVWKTNGERGVGFIAHELADVSPSSVSGEKDGMRLDKVKDENGEYVEKMIPNYQSVSYSSGELIANLVAEVQSLRVRLAAAGL